MQQCLMNGVKNYEKEFWSKSVSLPYAGANHLIV